VPDNVPRVSAPNPIAFDRRYLRSGTPVVLTGLATRHPVRRLADPRVARDVLADMRLRVAPNTWGDLLLGRDDPRSRQVGFGTFLDRLTAGEAGDDDYCVEHPTPRELADRLPVPSYVGLGERADSWESYVFLAGAGNTTHLHYDFDLRHVLMYQVFGRKRYVVIDMAESRKLAPGSRAGLRRTSALFLEHFSDADLAAFLRYTDAWSCVLEPGEMLLIPATCWHYVEYVDTALSVNFRLGRNRYLRALAEILPESSVELQSLAALFRDEDAVGPDRLDAFAALQAADERWYPDAATRLAALDALCVELCARLRLPVAGAAYHVADIERQEKVLAATRFG